MRLSENPQLGLALAFFVSAQCQSEGQVQIAVYSDSTCEKFITIVAPPGVNGTGCLKFVPGFTFDSALLTSGDASGVSKVYMC
jgi:hypothetical protein